MYKFNDKQQEAIDSESKNTLVIAGAGSGKTSVITGRITKNIKNGMLPSSIFAVTFTNKAAAEMKERIIKNIKSLNIHQEDKLDMKIGTFHGLFGRILKDNFKYTPLKNGYQLIDVDDQKAILKSAIENTKDYCLRKGVEKPSDTKLISNCIHYIGREKDNARRFKNSLWSDSDESYYALNCQIVYEEYERLMLQMNIVDFGDLLLYPYEIFKNEPSVLKAYQSEIKEVLVDEFQDTNYIQYELVKMLSKSGNLFVVGDDDQSIYSWRGAEIENILNFPKNMNAKVVKLEQNYRSLGNILTAANEIIKENKKRLGKNLWTDKDSGEKLVFRSFYADEEEASYIAKEIKKLQEEKNIPLSEIAILYRNNNLSRVIEKELITSNIDYEIVGGISFWKKSEVKDIIAILGLLENEVNYLGFYRAVKALTEGIGDVSLDKMVNYSFKNEMGLIEVIEVFIDNFENKDSPRLSSKQTTALKSVLSLFNNMKNVYRDINDLPAVITRIVETDFVNKYMSKDSDEAFEDRLQNISNLAKIAESINNGGIGDEVIEDISDFINYAMLQSTADKESKKDAVKLMTIHSSKGLEFDVVFISCASNEVIPSAISMRLGDIEEERRLFYVAVTRARKELYILRYNRLYGGQLDESIFIKDIPKEILSVDESKAGYFSKFNSYDRQQGGYDKIFKGAKIRHKKFGLGEVIDFSKRNSQMIDVVVNFEDFGIRRVLVKV